jgi:hypothetical protein
MAGFAGTYSTIATWAGEVIASVDGYNKVWTYIRKIRTTEQLIADFGTGTDNDEGIAMTRGWMLQVRSREVAERVGKSVVNLYGISYICLWSLEDRGANWSDFVAHVEEVADALAATHRPSAFTVPGSEIDLSRNEIANPVEIRDVYSVVFPLDSGRTHYRADLEQTIRLRQDIRS